MKLRLLFATVLIALVLIAPSAVYSSGYAIYTIGTTSDCDGSYGKDINNSGLAICTSASAIKIGTFIWSKQSGISDMPSTPCINDHGQTIGMVFNASINGFDWFVRNLDGSIERIVAGGRDVWFSDLNNAGQMLGYDGRDTIINNADGSITRIPSPNSTDPGNTNQLITDILSNTSQRLLSMGRHDSSVDDRAWVWNGSDGWTQLLSLEGTTNCKAYGINDYGYIVGQSNHERAVRWNPDGTLTDLGLGCAYAINNHGQVAGSTIGGKPVVWDIDGTIIELGMPDGADAVDVTAINDLGQVIGTKYTPIDTGYGIWAMPLAVMWDPVPEPGSLVSLIAGLAGIGMWMRNKK